MRKILSKQLINSFQKIYSFSYLKKIKKKKTNKNSLIRCFFTENERFIQQAKYLRYQSFAKSYGLKNDHKIDEDYFDNYCKHLVAVDEKNKVIGTYRLITRETQKICGNLYSDQEFDLVRLAKLKTNILEIGRVCIADDFKNKWVISNLWKLIHQYSIENNYNYICGVTSVNTNKVDISLLYKTLNERNYLAPIEYQVRPRVSYPIVENIQSQPGVVIPKLLKTYLKMGAWVCGAPYWDREFSAADFFTLISIKNLSEKYKLRLS